ncbi:MAG: hypothetical protein RIS53_121 [Bacillota bacterium]|jgi:uncharacterized membrane protein
MDFFFQVILTLIVFTVVDLFWLVKVAPKLYRKHIGHLMADQVNRIGALLFYVIFIVGLVLFVIYPYQDDLQLGILYGGAFGLVTYATYDLTNLATLKAWPVTITIIDLLWGTFVTAATSGLVIFVLGML